MTNPVRQRRLQVSAALAVAVVCWLAAAGNALAQDAAQAAAAHSVKAAYLFKLPAYVDWPAQRFDSPDAALTIGVLGADEVADALAALTSGRTVNGHPVAVRRLQSDEGIDGVHVLFFGSTAAERAGRIAADAAALNILTVTDLQAAFDDSVIDFVTVNGRVRFEVRLMAAERNGLRLHAGLLDVAARVHGARR
ncbi:MAG TPA: YfiR family protein [Gammaproteobacteria bacterium]|nr:YfiR family protein [Gammaproteobacteria bacterium]